MNGRMATPALMSGFWVQFRTFGIITVPQLSPPSWSRSRDRHLAAVFTATLQSSCEVCRASCTYIRQCDGEV